MTFELKKASAHDGKDIYELLQKIPADENGLINNVYNMTFDEYKAWLVKQETVSAGIGLESWQVPQTTYWFYVNDIPVGLGKLRHRMTEKLLKDGGNIGYAIAAEFRGKGYGKKIVAMLIDEARDLNIERLLFTIQNHNTPSIAAAKANGGVIEKVTDEKHYIWVDVTV